MSERRTETENRIEHKANKGSKKGSMTVWIRRLIHRGVAVLAICSAGGAEATPVISEIFYDAVGSDNGQSFVEIYGIAGFVLDGLTLEGINGSNGAVGPIIALSGVIPSDGIFVVADMDADGLTPVADFDLLATFDFQNGPDSIVLMEMGAAIDAVGYGVFSPGEIFAGEGTPAADAPAGSSLAREFADLDRDDNALDFIVLSIPTPGSVQLMAVPEPGSGLLTMAGLIGMCLLNRRCYTSGRRLQAAGVPLRLE